MSVLAIYEINKQNIITELCASHQCFSHFIIKIKLDKLIAATEYTPHTQQKRSVVMMQKQHFDLNQQS